MEKGRHILVGCQLLLWLVLFVAAQDENIDCDSFTYGSRDGHPVQLRETPLPIGVQTYVVDVPVAETCGYVSATGVTLQACGVGEVPSVIFESMEKAIVTRSGDPNAPVIVTATVYCKWNKGGLTQLKPIR